MTVVAAGLGTLPSPTWAAKSRIDLAEFGRVVHFPEVPTKVTTTKDELSRGSDGWDAVQDEDGQYSIGIEWDEPRDISEVNIEFRHAIADRELIKAQYWKEDKTASQPGDSKTKTSKHSSGRWLTPKAEWWAGDRDVSFAFAAQDAETANKNLPGKTVRRTTRLRFLCGRQELPPVRYLRAYGPGKVVVDTFDVRFDPKPTLALPVVVDVVNGFALSADGQAVLDSVMIRNDREVLVLRFFQNDETSPNRTEVILSSLDKPENSYRFFPAQVAKRGLVRIPAGGVVIERRGGKPATTRPVGDSDVKPTSIETKK